MASASTSDWGHQWTRDGLRSPFNHKLLVSYFARPSARDSSRATPLLLPGFLESSEK